MDGTSESKDSGAVFQGNIYPDPYATISGKNWAVAAAWKNFCVPEWNGLHWTDAVKLDEVQKAMEEGTVEQPDPSG